MLLIHPEENGAEDLEGLSVPGMGMPQPCSGLHSGGSAGPVGALRTTLLKNKVLLTQFASGSLLAVCNPLGVVSLECQAGRHR